jgi:predicted phage terminase large subunit-like protein
MSFRDFIAEVHPRYVFYPHCERLIAALQRVADGELKRLMVFMPPRHSKSETVSRLFPAYYLRRHPARFVGLASYGADLAYTLSRAARGFFQLADGALDPSAFGVKHWQTQSGGGMWATGVGGPATGKGASLAIVDDPVKDAEEAQSSATHRRHADWWQSTWSTRFEPDAAAVLLQTRWNEADLAGWLLEQERDGEEPEGWHVLNMPAIAEAPRSDWPAGVTLEPDPRPEGAALCEPRYPLSRLRKVEARIGAYWFGALYQQRPTPRSGGMFGRAVEILAAAPAPLGRLVIYIDKAGAAEGKGDYTAAALMAALGDGTYLILDVLRGQWPAAQRNAQIRERLTLWRARYGPCRVVIEQPPGLGKESTEALIKDLAGFAAFADPVRGDKVERAEPLAAQWQAGNVSLLAGPWVTPFLDELRAFPHGRNDDQVDASSGAFRHLVTMNTPGRPAVGGERQTAQSFRPR